MDNMDVLKASIVNPWTSIISHRLKRKRKSKLYFHGAELKLDSGVMVPSAVRKRYYTLLDEQNKVL